MKNLAPDILRKRLLIEGYFEREVDQKAIEDFFLSICQELNLRTYGQPIIFSPEGRGKEENEGYDAFIPLIDSGISLYVWSGKKFLACILFTCKDFDEKSAVEETKKFFQMKDVQFSLF